MTQQGQIKVFFACVFLGGCLYLLYRLTHIPRGKSKVGVAARDALFCVAAFFAVWFGLLYICDGSLRLYRVAGLALGYFLCAKTLGFYVDTALSRLYNLLDRKKLLRKNRCIDKADPSIRRTEK